MRFKKIAIISIALIVLGSFMLGGVPAQYSEYMDLTWSNSITVSKTYTWNFHEVVWPNLFYLEEPITTGSTIEFKILSNMPDNSSAYEDYCAGFDEVIEVSINGNVKIYSDVISGDYSTYLAYLLIPLEASHELTGTHTPMTYLPTVMELSSGGEISQENVDVLDDGTSIDVYAEEIDIYHQATLDSKTGVNQIWQVQDLFFPENHLTLTIEGYSGDIPPLGGDPGADDDIRVDDDFNWADYENWADNWSEDWDWEDLDVDWDEWDWEVDEFDFDVWSNGTEDLCFMNVNWTDLLEDFEELENFDWEEAGLEDLGLYFTLDSETEVNHIHMELEIELDDDLDPETLKLYYLDEEKQEWVVIETSGYNEDTGRLEADIDHLTVFAAMADDSAAPEEDAPSGFAVAGVILVLAGVVFLTSRRK